MRGNYRLRPPSPQSIPGADEPYEPVQKTTEVDRILPEHAGPSEATGMLGVYLKIKSEDHQRELLGGRRRGFS